MKFIKVLPIIILLFATSCNTEKKTDKGELKASNKQLLSEELLGTWVRTDYIKALKNTLTLHEVNKKYGKYTELQISKPNSSDTLFAELADVYGMMPYTLNSNTYNL